MEAVRKDGWDIKYVPEGLKIADLCLAAVQTDDRDYCFFRPRPPANREVVWSFSLLGTK